MKRVLSGNSAVAFGAYESGVKFATGYPGNPCTEVMNELSLFDGVQCEWAINEKVALEVAIGSSLSGVRTLVLMKTLGLNVAADAFTQLAGTPINGGLVLVVADDVGRIVGDDYQDCRNYGIMSKVPILEPSDSQEGKAFMKIAFEISEKYVTPVILRLNSVTCKSKSVVSINDNEKTNSYKRFMFNKSLQKTAGNIVRFGFDKYDSAELKRYWHDFKSYWDELSYFSNYIEINKVEKINEEVGIIATGVSYYYAKEVLPDVSYLKLGLVYPLPEELIKEFVEEHKKVYILEDGHPLIEKEIKSMGYMVQGESIFPRFPDMLYFTPEIIESKLKGIEMKSDSLKVPLRLPENCKGCPHMSINKLLKKRDIYAAGGIGCGALGVLPNIDAIDIVKCMGSAFGIAHGFNRTRSNSKKLVGIMGDGEFWHSGINGLLNAVHHDSNTLFIIQDNLSIAMTGGQRCVSTPVTEQENHRHISIEALCKAIGVKSIEVIDSYNVSKLEEVILKEIENDGVSVIISRQKCKIFQC